MFTGESKTGSTEIFPAFYAGVTVPSSASVVDSCETEEQDEIDQLAQALAIKFEELTLIHQLSERLKLDENSDQICQALLEELGSCIGAELIAIDLVADEESQSEAKLFQRGESIDPRLLGEIGRYTLGSSKNTNGNSARKGSAAIVNTPADHAPHLVRSVVVKVQHHDNVLGHMIAIRPLTDPEFGTVEADLMMSTSMMLGVHLINQRQYSQMQQMFEGTIQSLVSALDAKDTYTCGHSSRVAELAVELAKRLDFTEEDLNRIRMAGILHDIGKIGVDDSVLRKPGKLTEEEFEQIKQHPMLGFEILKGIRPFGKILPAVRHHHESWDGTGYPDGLIGKSIPRDAQVLAVADAFDAMTSDRPYRNGMPLDRVIEIFRRGRGQQWAADVVDVLLDCPDVMHAYAHRERPTTR